MILIASRLSRNHPLSRTQGMIIDVTKAARVPLVIAPEIPIVDRARSTLNRALFSCTFGSGGAFSHMRLGT